MSDTPPDASIRNTLERLLLSLHQRAPFEGRSTEALRPLWRAAAGDFLGRHARLIGLSRGVLRIGVDSSSLRDEVTRMTPELIERLGAAGATGIVGISVALVSHFERPPIREAAPAPDSPSPADSEVLPPASHHPELEGVRDELRSRFDRLLTLDHQRREKLKR